MRRGHSHRVPSHRPRPRASVLILVAVRPDHPARAPMLVARAARLARQARVHDAPHAAPIADREPRDAVADRDDLARELVARHRWIRGRAERAPQAARRAPP